MEASLKVLFKDSALAKDYKVDHASYYCKSYGSDDDQPDQPNENCTDG